MRVAVSSNKRKHPRVQADGVFSHFKVGDELALGMLVENISLGGLFVRTDQPLPRGTPLVLEVVRAGPQKAIKLAGRVVTTVPAEEARRRGLTPGMGIRFDPVSAEVLKRLEELVGAIVPPLDPTAPINPTQVDLSRRSVFDFGFVSLENVPEASAEIAPTPPKRTPAPTPPWGPPGTASLPPSEDAAAPPGASSSVVVVEGARLMLQIRGLLMELSEANAELDRKREENAQLRALIEQKDRRIAELAAKR